jgi:hypothetical protein
MANYYTSFCAKLEMSDAAFQYLDALDAAVLAVENGEDLVEDVPAGITDIAEKIYKEREQSSGCSIAYQEGFAIVEDVESGSIAVLGDILHATMKAFDMKSPLVVNYADWCDKHRVDGFGGGVLVVTADRVYRMSTDEWANDLIAKLASETSVGGAV